jgi:hypothetical protein
MIRTLFVCALCLLFSFVAWAAPAADITGTWVAKIQGQNGESHSVSFTFKNDGGKVTGTEGRANADDVEITDGKLESDTLTFAVRRNIGDRTLALHYTGKVSGDKIGFTVKVEGSDQARQFEATRTK